MQRHGPPTLVWHRWLGALVAFGLALALYASTAAPGLSWAHSGADGGDLIAAAETWGVPHPTGYPTYIILARLFAEAVPLAPIARRYNLFSSLAAALSVSLAYLWARRVLAQTITHTAWQNSLAALGGALCWATGPYLWSQAVITEVYALQSFFAALALLLTAAIDAETRPHGRLYRWAILGTSLGLALGAHLTSVLLWPGLAVVLWRRLSARRYAVAAASALLGTAVYLYIPLAAGGLPPVNWGNASDLAGFWWLLSGRIYQGYLLGLPLSALPTRLAAWAQIWREQITTVGMAVAGMGLISLPDVSRHWLWATLTTALLYSVYAITYDTTDSYVYMLTALMMASLWLALGARATVDLVTRQRSRISRSLESALVAVLLVSIAGWLAVQNASDNSLRHERAATTWLNQTLAQLPNGAILVTGQDRHTFAMDYAQWAEARRQDVIVVDGELTPYGWYWQQLSARHPDLRIPSQEQDWVAWLTEQATQRSIFTSSPRPELGERFESQPVNGLSELVPRP